MGKWIEISQGVIPPGDYTADITTGEDGTVIMLEKDKDLIRVSFGALYALRILDEGVILKQIYDETEYEKYESEAFSNVIYRLDGEEFGNFVKDTSIEEVYEGRGFKHYLLVTLNYFIEIISPWEPKIERVIGTVAE